MSVWYEKKAKSVMTTGVRAKFEQNPNLANYLVQNTANNIAEVNPRDSSLPSGCHYDDSIRLASLWKGETVLGDILMSVKEKMQATLRKEVLL